MDSKNHREIKCGKGYMRITNKESTIELMVVSQKKIQNKTRKPRVFQADVDREAVYLHWTDFRGRKGGVRSGDSGTAGQALGVGKSGGASRKWVRAHQAGAAWRKEEKKLSFPFCGWRTDTPEGSLSRKSTQWRQQSAKGRCSPQARRSLILSSSIAQESAEMGLTWV